MAIRAIHLELVPDLTAESFLHAFRRFIARFGTPKSVTSDNGTNFQLGSKAIIEAWNSIFQDDSLQSYVANHGIKWYFITQRAPCRGGYYERLIGIVKNCLRRCLGK